MGRRYNLIEMLADLFRALVRGETNSHHGADAKLFDPDRFGLAIHRAVLKLYAKLHGCPRADRFRHEISHTGL